MKIVRISTRIPENAVLQELSYTIYDQKTGDYIWHYAQFKIIDEMIITKIDPEKVIIVHPVMIKESREKPLP